MCGHGNPTLTLRAMLDEPQILGATSPTLEALGGVTVHHRVELVGLLHGGATIAATAHTEAWGAGLEPKWLRDLDLDFEPEDFACELGLELGLEHLLILLE